MNRLTLILSDLYLPAEAAAGALPDTLELPNLEWLLRFADDPRVIDDWRRWLARELGAEHVARRAVADILAPGAWLATPVHLEARLDHVRLRDRGLLRIPADERARWHEEFAQTFGPGLALHDAGERAFLLTGGPRAEIPTLDPARLLDADVGAALRAGSSGARELRRLGTEIEMWLHRAAVNERRERAGQRRVSALWLWGGGVGAASEQREQRDADRAHRLFGADPLFAVLAKCGFTTARPAPGSLADVGAGASAWVELAPMSGDSHERLSALETNWFTPARAALAAGALESVTLVANDRVFTVRSGAGWRRWRRRRNWLDLLRRPSAAAKA